MKLVFLFISGKTGFGGHHVSTRDIVSSIRNKGHECWVIGFGEMPSKVFANDNYYLHFDISPFNLVERIKLKRTLSKESFDAYFPIDETSCRILFSIYPYTVKQTIPIKPGWINVSSWTNLTSDFICFSKENYDYMQSLAKYSSVNVHLIPNRVFTVKQDLKRIEQFKKTYKIKKQDFLLLGVSRIDPDKIPVFKALATLYEKLAAIKLPVKAFIIGTVSSEDTLKCIQKEFSDKICIVTDTLYTTNVSQLLSVSYAVVGMGRTAMEGMSLGIPTFIPHKHSQMPLLIDSESLESALISNLTYRTDVTKSLLSNNMTKIENLHSDYENICNETRKLFQINLDVDSGTEKYLEIVEKQKKNAHCYMKDIRAYLYSNIRWTSAIIYSKIKKWKN